MSTRKMDEYIRREHYCLGLDEALIGTNIRVYPGEPFSVVIAGVTPGDLAPLLDDCLAIVGREPRARPWRGRPPADPPLTWDEYNN